MDCMRRRSFELAISRRIRFSSTEPGGPQPAFEGALPDDDELRPAAGATGESAFSLFTLQTKRRNGY